MIDDDDLIVFPFVLLVIFLVGLCIVNSVSEEVLKNAHDNIEEYTNMYNECLNNNHNEKIVSHICVEFGYRNCVEYYEQEKEIIIYDVEPNNMKCEDIINKYKIYSDIINNEEKEKNS